MPEVLAGVMGDMGRIPEGLRCQESLTVFAIHVIQSIVPDNLRHWTRYFCLARYPDPRRCRDTPRYRPWSEEDAMPMSVPKQKLEGVVTPEHGILVSLLIEKEPALFLAVPDHSRLRCCVTDRALVERCGGESHSVMFSPLADLPDGFRIADSGLIMSARSPPVYRRFLDVLIP